MQFLRTLFYVVATIIAVVFAMRNWTPVTVNLWGGFAADAKLPVLLVLAWAVGFVPTLAAYHVTRWRYRRRLDQAERALAEARGLEPPATAVAPPPASAAPPVSLP